MHELRIATRQRLVDYREKGEKVTVTLNQEAWEYLASLERLQREGHLHEKIRNAARRAERNRRKRGRASDAGVNRRSHSRRVRHRSGRADD